MKDNKKQLIVVVALAFVIVTVGVFQFIASNQAPPPPRQAKKNQTKSLGLLAENTPKTEDQIKNRLFVDPLPDRDPFQAEILPQTPDTQPQIKSPTVATPRIDHPISKGGGLPGPVTIDPSSFAGAIGPKGTAVEPEKFGFTVAGIMLGEKPMAVFADAQGNQRLIMLGGSLDPDSQVVSIDKDAVTVRFHGKTLRLTVEGNPNAK